MIEKIAVHRCHVLYLMTSILSEGLSIINRKILGIDLNWPGLGQVPTHVPVNYV